MARPIKAELKDTIRSRSAELRLDNPLHKTSEIVAILSKEFGLSPRTIWYHLRLVDKPDSRLRYTELERARISAMSRSELEVLAARRGVAVSTLYAVGWRYKNAQMSREANLEAQQEVCESIGYLNFTKTVDLRAFGFSRSAFRDARKEISKINGLDLQPPNFLLHPRTKRFYMLSLSDQRFLLTSPRKFLAERAAHINANWKSYDPSHYYFVVVDTRFANPYDEGVVISCHEDMDGALRAVQVCENADPPIPAKIFRSPAGSRGGWFKPGERRPKADPTPMGAALPLPGLDTDFLEAKRGV